MHKRWTKPRRARNSKKVNSGFVIDAKSGRYALVMRYASFASFREFATVEEARKFAVKRYEKVQGLMSAWHIKDMRKNTIVWSNG